MRFDPDKHHRRSIRLQGYNYSEPGAYFVTVCTQNRECLFGEIVDGQIQLNGLGEIVVACWFEIPIHFPHAELDVFVVMPNHIHGIIGLTDIENVGAMHASPLQRHPRGPRSQSIGAIVGSFKSAVTKRINTLHDTQGVPVWQRNYYEHISRNERELDDIRQYIADNPARWSLDRENPNSRGRQP